MAGRQYINANIVRYHHGKMSNGSFMEKMHEVPVQQYVWEQFLSIPMYEDMPARGEFLRRSRTIAAARLAQVCGYLPNAVREELERRTWYTYDMRWWARLLARLDIRSNAIPNHVMVLRFSCRGVYVPEIDTIFEVPVRA